jgi:hypothetical protein
MENLLEVIKECKEDEINEVIDQFRTKGGSNEKHTNLLLNKLSIKYSHDQHKDEPIKEDFDLC